MEAKKEYELANRKMRSHTKKFIYSKIESDLRKNIKVKNKIKSIIYNE